MKDGFVYTQAIDNVVKSTLQRNFSDFVQDKNTGENLHQFTV